MKIHDHDASHMNKMAATLIMYGKNFSKIFYPLNRGPISQEAWYVASGIPAHHSLFKWWPWVDLDLFYSKVKFRNLGFSTGKIENWIFRNYWSLWPESW